MERRGSLHLGLRIEAAAALITAKLLQVNGNRAKVEDFMPHYDKVGGGIDLSGESASIEDAFKIFSRAAEFTQASKGKGQPRKANDEYLSGKE